MFSGTNPEKTRSPAGKEQPDAIIYSLENIMALQKALEQGLVFCHEDSESCATADRKHASEPQFIRGLWRFRAVTHRWIELRAALKRVFRRKKTTSHTLGQ